MQRNDNDIFTAIQKGDAAEVGRLVLAGADITKTNENNRKPIEVASMNNQWDCVQAIVDNKKLENSETGGYGFAFVLALKCDKFDVAKALLAAGAVTTWHTVPDKDTSLHLAVKKRNLEMLDLLLKANASLTVENKDGRTPMQLATDQKYWDVIEKIAQSKHAEANGSDKYGTAIYYAVYHQQVNTVEVLINAGAPINWENSVTGDRYLHQAVKNKDLAMVKLLLNHSASQSETNKDNKTPVELACELGAWDCAQALLEHVKIDDNTKKLAVDLHYENALISTIKQENYAIAKLLLERSAPCKSWNTEVGNIPLYWAINTKGTNPEIVTLLIEGGADPNVKNKSGQTTSDLARKLGRFDCLQKIVRKHPEIMNVDINASLNEASEIFESLLENRVPLKDMDSKFNGITKCYRDIFDKDLSELKARRDAIKHSLPTHSEYLKQATNPQTELGDILMLISILHEIDEPLSPAQIQYLQDNKAAVARHILDFDEIRQKHDRFTTKIKCYLDQLDEKVQNTKWQVLNMLGNWTDGEPNHVTQLRKQLVKRGSSCSGILNLKVYVEVRRILGGISDSDRRHPDTAVFYQEELKQAKAIKFSASDKVPLIESLPPAYQLSSSQMTSYQSIYPQIYPPVSDTAVGLPAPILPQQQPVGLFDSQAMQPLPVLPKPEDVVATPDRVSYLFPVVPTHPLPSVTNVAGTLFAKPEVDKKAVEKKQVAALAYA